MAASSAQKEFAFGRFVARRDERQLLVDGEPAKLGARAFDLLLTLAERRDRVVSKNELLDVVWPGLVVEENNLQVHISALRKLLGPSAIATVPGRGYRFTAPVDTAANDGRPAAALPATPDLQPAAGAVAGNLPAPGERLFGREPELAQVHDRLATGQRLLTIAGAGGIGKTRLALAAAWQAQGRFADGAWLVELAPVADPRLVASGIACALGVSLEAPAGPEQLADRLGERRLLLVLDNCEHLVAAAAEVAATLLRACPGVRLIATSQEPLKLADEHLLRLGPLAVPGLDDPASAAGDAALALFAARAQAANPCFTLDADNRAAVADICRRLDGIPLAIELAAARWSLLGIDGLRQRLDDRFRLLTAGNRGAPRRQQTLRAAIEWSHAQLNADEQLLLRRLGIFHGGFGLDAAQQVGMDDAHDEWAVLDHLGALVDKSLVIVDAGEPPRYRLLESTRAFALEQLAASGEAGGTARRHAEAVLGLLQRADAQRWHTGDSRQLLCLLPELDNLRAALAWSAGPGGDDRLLVALAGLCGWVWKTTGLTAEGSRWCDEAHARLDAVADEPALQAQLLYAGARLAHQTAAAKEFAALERATEIYRGLGDRRGVYLCRTLAAQKLAWRYDLDEAERAIGEATEVADRAWPALARGDLLLARTFWCEASGRPAEGQPLAEELLALYEASGDPHEVNTARINLAENLFVQGKVDEAIALRRQVVQDSGHSLQLYAITNLANLSAALTYRGETDEALATGRAALKDMVRIGRLEGFADHFALLACQRGRHAVAARLAGWCDAHYAQSGFRRELSEQRARDMTAAALAAVEPPLPVDDWLAEGGGMSGEVLSAQALGD
ncbi:MAG: winged helix-turn-helix domain-containing protein [Burkholderiaceae bacterium]